MTGWTTKGWRTLLLIALAMAVGACVQRKPVAAKPSPVPVIPRLTASVATLVATNEWRPVVSAVRVAERSGPAKPMAPVVAVPAAPEIAGRGAPPSPKVMRDAAPAVAAVSAAGSAALAGSGGAYRLRPGDPVIINLRGIPKEEEFENQVDEGGFVKLPYLERVLAAGLTCSQLEDEIEKLYVNGKIYRQISVNVNMRAQSYFIQGEVKIPGRVQLVTDVTLLQAIAQAGGYTEYADEGDVRIIRAGKTNPYNAKELKKFPERDVRIEPGDVINVERSVF